MQKNDIKHHSVTVRIWSETYDRLMALSNESGMKFTEYVDELSLRADGNEIIKDKPLGPKRLRNEESYQEGRAGGYIEACADLADKYGQDELAVDMANYSGFDMRQAAEWDLMILRKIDSSIPRGMLIRNHPRSPKNQTSEN